MTTSHAILQTLSEAGDRGRSERELIIEVNTLCYGNPAAPSEIRGEAMKLDLERCIYTKPHAIHGNIYFILPKGAALLA